jgi:hypothetical protein
MVQVTATLCDSGNQPLNGTLTITLDGLLVNDTTSPDRILTLAPRTLAITNGVVAVDLPESETTSVTYRFQFVPTGGTTPVLDFHAKVPNQAAVDLSELVPTGLTTDTLDTGIRRVAQVLTSVEVYRQALMGGPRFRGNYSATTWYINGDAVNYNSATWVWADSNPGQGQTPSGASPYWQQLYLS